MKKLFSKTLVILAIICFFQLGALCSSQQELTKQNSDITVPLNDIPNSPSISH